MDNENEEKYVSFRIAHSDMEQVENVLSLARQCTDLAIQYSLIQIAIITYARPFGKSNGIHVKKFKTLESKKVFCEINSDHDLLIAERDQRIAHGDISEFKPTLGYWPKSDIFPIMLRSSQLYNDKVKLIDLIDGLCKTTKSYIENEMKLAEDGFRKLNK